jgi:hypothetical protein
MMMKINKWTLGLAAVGLVTIPASVQAQEKLSALQTAVSSTTISGYVDTSAHWAIGSGSVPPAYAFNTPSKQDGFNLNVVNLRIEKPLDEKENWAAGYMIDTLYGPNAVGWNPSYNGSQTSDFAIKQAYVSLRVPVGNGLDFKMGSFDSVIGYEVFHSGNNPNYTRSWGYTFEPTEHTGLLSSYQITKEIGIAGGIANTANAGINNRSFLTRQGVVPIDYNSSESYKTYMGALTLTAPESMGFLKGSTLYGAVVNGFDTGYAGGLGDTRTWWYAGMTLNTPVTGLRIGAAYDYISGNGSDQSAAEDMPGNWFNALSAYISYQATEHLSFHARGEYMWMKKGNAAAINLLSIGEDGLGSPVGIADSIVALTGTIQYDLWANALTRLEFRWDHAADGTRPFNEGEPDAFLLAANVIFKF